VVTQTLLRVPGTSQDAWLVGIEEWSDRGGIACILRHIEYGLLRITARTYLPLIIHMLLL
jgi:hypothetical protein